MVIILLRSHSLKISKLLRKNFNQTSGKSSINWGIFWHFHLLTEHFLSLVWLIIGSKSIATNGKTCELLVCKILIKRVQNSLLLFNYSQTMSNLSILNGLWIIDRWPHVRKWVSRLDLTEDHTMIMQMVYNYWSSSSRTEEGNWKQLGSQCPTHMYLEHPGLPTL